MICDVLTTNSQLKMKHIKLFLVIPLFLFAFGQQANSQVIKAGGGVELRSDPPVGMIAKFTYNLGVLDPNLRISLDAALIPNFEANLDLHYSFMREFGFDAYGLGGVNLASNIGINAGAGINIELSETLDAFGEVKYLINRSPQASIKLGVLYNL